MKNRIDSIILLFCIFFLFISCGGDSSIGSEEADPSIGVITADIDGINWEASEISASIISGIIGITAIDPNGGILSITLQDDKERIYDLTHADDDGNASYIQDRDSKFITIFSKAEFILEEVNWEASTISGSFNLSLIGNGDQRRMFSNGRIDNVKFLSGDIINNEFEADVDGKAFNAITTSALSKFEFIRISAIEGAKEIVLRIPIGTNEGNFDIDLSSLTPKAHYFPNSLSTFQGALDGTVEVINHNRKERSLEGAFTFDSESLQNDTGPIYQVRNGKFMVKY